MKIKEGYILETIAGQKIAISLDMAQDKFSGMIKLNDVGAFLWELLENETEEKSLISALTETYEVPEEIAAKDVAAFLEKLEKSGILEK